MPVSYRAHAHMEMALDRLSDAATFDHRPHHARALATDRNGPRLCENSMRWTSFRKSTSQIGSGSVFSNTPRGQGPSKTRVNGVFTQPRPKAEIADADLEAANLPFGICALGTSMGPSMDSVGAAWICARVRRRQENTPSSERCAGG